MMVGDEMIPLCLPLPEDVIFQILLWLPVISLLRFKLVCKSWYSLIQTPTFIHRHIAFKGNYHRYHHNYQHYVYKFVGDHFEDFFYLLSAAGKKFDQLSFKNMVLSPYFPTKTYLRFLNLLACCDGIICIHDYEFGVFVLWNPATKQVRPFPSKGGPDSYTSFGFGFDVKSNDYKVVQVHEFIPLDSKPHQVQVYNCTTRTWRTLIDPAMPYKVIRDKVATYLNGFLCWLGRRRPAYSYSSEFCDTIVSFDLTNEVITSIPLPDLFFDPTNSTNYWPRLYLLGENIACIGRDCLSDVTPFEVWVMYEFGIKESWAKLYTIGRFAKPVGFSYNGEFVFLCVDRENYALYDSVTQEIIKNFQVQDGDSNVFVYKESLLSIE